MCVWVLETPAHDNTARFKLVKYRAIHKCLRDFRPLRYSSRDNHAEGEHVNRGRDTPSLCPTLQVLDMSTLGVCLSCCAVQFGSSGGTYELPCMFMECTGETQVTFCNCL